MIVGLARDVNPHRDREVSRIGELQIIRISQRSEVRHGSIRRRFHMQRLAKLAGQEVRRSGSGRIVCATRCVVVIVVKRQMHHQAIRNIAR